MRLSEARQIVSEARGWKPTGGGGYELALSDDALATLQKVGDVWTLSAGNHTLDLGKRASFDHAEGALKKWGLA